MKHEKADKNRHTIWLTDEAWSAVSRHYREDNCSAHNEYIEKAIKFYSGYLDTQNASAYLPRILAGSGTKYDSKYSRLRDQRWTGHHGEGSEPVRPRGQADQR